MPPLISIWKSCPLCNFKTVKDIFMTLGTKIKQLQTMCRELIKRKKELFTKLCPFKDLLPCWWYKNDCVKYYIQYFQNDIIIHLSNSIRIIFVKTNFTPKEIIDFTKSQTAIEIALLDKDNYSYVAITCTNKKITCTLSYKTRGKNR